MPLTRWWTRGGRRRRLGGPGPRVPGAPVRGAAGRRDRGVPGPAAAARRPDPDGDGLPAFNAVTRALALRRGQTTRRRHRRTCLLRGEGMGGSVRAHVAPEGVGEVARVELAHAREHVGRVKGHGVRYVDVLKVTFVIRLDRKPRIQRPSGCAARAARVDLARWTSRRVVHRPGPGGAEEARVGASHSVGGVPLERVGHDRG